MNLNEQRINIEESEVKEDRFENRTLLVDYLRKEAHNQGYSLSIIDTRATTVTLGCDRGGKYRDRGKSDLSDKRRCTGSRLINCPFKIKGRKFEDGSWSFALKNSEHNHEVSVDVSGHPYARRLSENELLQIKEMTEAGIQPRKMLTALRKNNPSLQAISRDIYNAKAKVRRDYLNGRSTLQALFDELVDGGFSYDVECDQNGHLTHVFFAHPLSMHITRNYNVTFIMDCTYKTNKYNMPLLDIVGITGFNTSFYSCFAFMRKEETEDYTWALTKFKNLLGENSCPSVIISDRELALMKAIPVVFPSTINILCRWHINKNVLKNCKPIFANDIGWENFLSRWNLLIDVDTENGFDASWDSFKIEYARQEMILQYINSTWLPYKEMFVKAWIKQHLHFGNVVTSKAEGAHSILKKYLEVSTGCLQEVKRKICLAIENQFHEVKTCLSSEKVRLPHLYNIPVFQNIVHHVSHFALGKLFEQLEFATKDSCVLDCSNQFTTSMGLPCAHKIKDGLERSEPLDISVIHPQWRIDDKVFTHVDVDFNVNYRLNEMKGMLDHFYSLYKQWPSSHRDHVFHEFEKFLEAVNLNIIEPEVRASRGRPKGSTNSTKRDPSAFENLGRRKCRICKGVDHNSRTCPRRLESTSSTCYLVNSVDDENFGDDLVGLSDDAYGFHYTGLTNNEEDF